MPVISELKEQRIAETPLLLFECELPDGQTERWGSHAVTVEGNEYEARVLGHNVFEVQTASDQGVDVIPRLALTLANADSHFSQIERALGWKGSKLRARFVFMDAVGGGAASESAVLFQGIVNPPEEVTESTFRLSAINRMSMQRVLQPEVRIQRRCPWEFPTTAAQRLEAVDGGAEGKYSRFYRCGYSPDAGGPGRTVEGGPFTGCSYTRSDCEARGMFSEARRFGGIEFVPSSILVRSYGEKGAHASPVLANEARYNDFVPLTYGTAWFSPPIVFARNDGNLTRMEVLLGMGEIQGVLKILVNDIEIPLGKSGTNMTGTGWYNVVSLGNRTGGFNLDFADAGGVPQGDPYGSMAYLSVVIPNRINDGGTTPRVRVLVEGLRLWQCGTEGNALGESFSANPAWVLLDILRRSGWFTSEIDLVSFARAAEYCDEQITTHDIYGNSIVLPRFQCNLVVQKRRTAADLIRGIRNAARLFLTYGANGLLQLRVENALALQQDTKPAGSNSQEPLDGGWPAYEFGDGASGSSGILRNRDGSASIRMWSRSTADTPNRFAVEFQDSLNEYQQDSFSLVDVEDVARTGQEITAPLNALGLPNYDQAARILKFNLDKAIEGNTYVQFETSVKALGLRPGDLISLTYLKEGLERQPFRVLKIAPGMNFRTATITAQIHRDEWYLDTNGQTAPESGGRQPVSAVGLPRPLLGTVTDGNGELQFEITPVPGADDAGTVEVEVGFLVPGGTETGGPRIPMLNLAPIIISGGTLAGGQTLYYCLSAVGVNGEESAHSFIVRAQIPSGANDKAVTLANLRFAAETSSFHVYRGDSPTRFFRIASSEPLAASFTDTGLERQVAAPKDANYDHVNFYWRLELLPEYPATLHSENTIGNTNLQMSDNRYRGKVVRIERGKGAGQERTVMANTSTVLTVSPAWAEQPDASCQFTVAEPGWRFGSTGRSSPVQFGVANRTGAVVQICGRAANALNVESPAELATVTRWVVGGGSAETGVPPTPVFGLGALDSGGGAELSGISFADLTNTRSITAGTLTLYYIDELAGSAQHALAGSVGAEDQTISLTPAGSASPGRHIQIEGEVLRIEEVSGGGESYRVSRGIHGSGATEHAAGATVYQLDEYPVIVPFVRDFFGSPLSGSWSYPVLLPNARIASAELVMTNAWGDSEPGVIALTQTQDYGLRTLSGGQYSIQVEGFLAIDQAAAPDIVVDSARSVRDVYAVLKSPPLGSPVTLQVKRDGILMCSLTIPAGATVSSAVDGMALGPLPAGARLSLEVTGVGQEHPGADLTVVIRL